MCGLDVTVNGLVRTVLVGSLAFVGVSAGAAGSSETKVAGGAGHGDRGELIVFVQPDASAVSRRFSAEYLPAIRKVAAEMEVPVRVVGVRRGAPADVTITPLIVYQNHRGRSVFQGRYVNVDRIRSFLRTARAVPQQAVRQTRRAIDVFRDGRALVGAPLKIAPVTGSQPKGYEHERFVAEARRAIEEGFTRLKRSESVSLGRGDRLFYMDCYPWRSEGGDLYVSVALYSQFHCKKPVFTRMKDPIVGRWAERDRVFARAGAVLESALLAALADDGTGDGFDAVPSEVAEVTWESLGLGLPASPAKVRAAVAGRISGRAWVVEARKDAIPQVEFRFPAPLDAYAGEALSVGGRIVLGEDLRLAGTRGSFEVQTDSVTMGGDDIDKAIHGAVFLDVARYPTSTFVIESAQSGDGPVAFGRVVNGTLRGVFTMKGVGVPLTVRTSLEAVVDEKGRTRLLMDAGFEIPLSPFGMEGPDGPRPEKETLVFDVRLWLKQG